ncbi:4639_t:CDS:1, partial [Scutellospora calospora]
GSMMTEDVFILLFQETIRKYGSIQGDDLIYFNLLCSKGKSKDAAEKHLKLNFKEIKEYIHNRNFFLLSLHNRINLFNTFSKVDKFDSHLIYTVIARIIILD